MRVKVSSHFGEKKKSFSIQGNASDLSVKFSFKNKGIQCIQQSTRLNSFYKTLIHFASKRFNLQQIIVSHS